MKVVKENYFEFILLIGIILISVGFFMLNVPAGFIVTGILLVFCVLLLWKVQQEGGD